MRLLELRIRNVRGIRQLDLSPNGKSIIIKGANGTGKSALVDAVDFLLTGEIDRLSGRRGVSQRLHGRHVTARAEDAFVEAKVQIPGVAAPIALRRTFTAPASLEAPSESKSFLAPFLRTASQRQHILTRTNILRFISSAPKDRATLVQGILNLDRIEETRKALTTAANGEKAKLYGERNARVTAQGALSATLSISLWSETQALVAINRSRATLSGAAVETLGDAKSSLAPPVATLAEPRTPTIHDDVRRVGESLTDTIQEQLDASDSSLLSQITTLHQDPDKLRAARQVELVELGVRMLDGSGLCPLCDTLWKEEALQAHLSAKLESGKEAAKTWRQVRQISDSLLGWIADHPTTVNRIIGAGRHADGGTDPALLSPFLSQLEKLKNALADPLANYTAFREAGRRLSEQLGLAEVRESLRAIYRKIMPALKPDPVQAAWDTLTRAEENIKALGTAMQNEAKAKESAQRLGVVRAAFIGARDEVLTALYESVKGRFVSLYKQLHNPEEQNFDAMLEPDKAGLDLQVDFCGTGKVAPFALHSEGHQDSMGLCLFLALAERFQGTRLGFFMFDDIVMSVDVGHRFAVAKLLAEFNSTTQLIITTHDEVWVKQLQSVACVASRDTTRLLGWSLAGGTVVCEGSDFLDEVARELGQQNVRAAAAALRHGLESYFNFVADAIGAEVPYSLAGQYDLGQLFNASCGRQKKLLSKALNAARSWNQDEALKRLTAFEKTRGEVLENAGAERWAVNPNVHFNQWMNMTPEEFAPVANAFTEVCKLFQCPACTSILSVVREGASPVSVKCPCSATEWNLQKRS